MKLFQRELTNISILLLMTIAAVPADASPDGSFGGMVRHHWRVHFSVRSGKSSSRINCTRSFIMRIGALRARIKAWMALGLYGGQTTFVSKYRSNTCISSAVHRSFKSWFGLTCRCRVCIVLGLRATQYCKESEWKCSTPGSLEGMTWS